MVSFVRISVLIWADILAGFAMWVMITYLTNVWKISFTHAAGIVNIWGGISFLLPVPFAFLVDTLMGNYSMLLLSSVAYCIGLGLLSMSTPTVLSSGTCSEYRPECIGQTQKVLFYSALALIAVGISGHLVSLNSFLTEQTTSETENVKAQMGGKFIWQIAGIFGVVLVSIIGGLALPFIKPWSIRFGIPAICSLVATLLFLSGSCSYKFNRPQGSPLTTVFRVFVASASNIFEPLPNNSNCLHEKVDTLRPLPHTRGLRCFDKAAIISPRKTQEEQEKNKWRLCRITEVEETKIVIRMIPMWLTFIVCGLVLSIGNTYFLEQANHMNRKVGHLKLPLPFFLLLYNSAKSLLAELYKKMASSIGRYGPPIGIAVAMIFSILCCITAAKVETRRLGVIERHGILDKPNEKIPMSIFWLLPQFLLLAALDGISGHSIAKFFDDQAPTSMKKYRLFFTNAVLGLGIMSSVLSVYIVGKVSERGGKPSWFQYTLNKSHLDNYYWTLAALSAVNLVLYVLVASLYSYRESEVEDQAAVNAGVSATPFEDNAQNCCCCC